MSRFLVETPPAAQLLLVLGLGSAALLLLLLLAHIGRSAAAPKRFVSGPTTAGFGAGCCWVAGLLVRAERPTLWAIAGGLLAGVALAVVLWRLLILLGGRAPAARWQPEELVGQTAVVTRAILPKGHAGGRVEVLVRGRPQHVDATTSEEVELAPGDRVRVEAFAEETVVVSLLYRPEPPLQDDSFDSATRE